MASVTLIFGQLHRTCGVSWNSLAEWGNVGSYPDMCEQCVGNALVSKLVNSRLADLLARWSGILSRPSGTRVIDYPACSPARDPLIALVPKAVPDHYNPGPAQDEYETAEKHKQEGAYCRGRGNPEDIRPDVCATDPYDNANKDHRESLRGGAQTIVIRVMHAPT